MRVGEVLDGRYRLVRQIAAHGIGAVWEAYDIPEGRLVAVKMLREDLVEDSSVIEQFSRDARGAVAARSSMGGHLVEPLDLGGGRGRPVYLVMELLEGEHLGAILERDGLLEPQRAAELVRQACQGLEALHGLGRVHGRLAPPSLFVTRKPDGSEWVKLLDGGLPSFNAGQGGVSRSSPSGRGDESGERRVYLAPEQLEAQPGVEVDRRADVYAVGAVLYRALTGKLPFPPDAEDGARRRGSPLPLRHHRASLGIGLEQIVLKAMAADRSQRHRSVAELAAALAPYADEDSDALGPGLGLEIPPPAAFVPPPPARFATQAPSPRERTEDIKLEELEFIDPDEAGELEPELDDEDDDGEVADDGEPATLVDAEAAGEFAAPAAVVALPGDEREEDTEVAPPADLAPLGDLAPLPTVDLPWRSRRRLVLVAVAALVVLLGLGLAIFLSSGDGRDGDRLVASRETAAAATGGAAALDAALAAVVTPEAAPAAPDASAASGAGPAAADAAAANAASGAEPAGAGADAAPSPAPAAQADGGAPRAEPSEPGGASGERAREPSGGGSSSSSRERDREREHENPPRTPDETTQALRALGPEVRGCYRLSRTRTVVIRFRVAADGALSYQAADPDPSSLTERCLRRVASAARVPAPPGGATTVNFPYILRR